MTKQKTGFTILVAAITVVLFSFTSFALGAGTVKGSTITYTYSGKISNHPVEISLYMLTNNAKIKVYKNASDNPPEAKNGTKLSYQNMTSKLAKGTHTTHGSLRITDTSYHEYKVADRVTYSYTYTGGVFSGTVVIENPNPNLTGIAFVGRDGANHYYAVDNTTIDISEYVRTAVKNSSSSGSSEKDQSNKESEMTSSNQQTTGAGTNQTTAAGQKAESDQGTSSGSNRQQESVMESKKSDIKAEIENVNKDEKNSGDQDNNSSSGGMGGNTGGSGAGSGNKDRPPCILRRFFGV